MNATQQLHALGQSRWLDNITHALLTSGTRTDTFSADRRRNTFAKSWMEPVHRIASKRELP